MLDGLGIWICLHLKGRNAPVARDQRCPQLLHLQIPSIPSANMLAKFHEVWVRERCGAGRGVYIYIKCGTDLVRDGVEFLLEDLLLGLQLRRLAPELRPEGGRGFHLKPAEQIALTDDGPATKDLELRCG